MTHERIIAAALGAYQNACDFPHFTEVERAAARSAVRDIMVRLGLYHDFLEALDIEPVSKPPGSP